MLRFSNGAIGKANAEVEPLAFGSPEVLMSELAADRRIKLFERARLDDLTHELEAEDWLTSGPPVILPDGWPDRPPSR